MLSMMKRVWIAVFVLACLSSWKMSAQKRVDPNSYKREVGFTIGASGPVGMSDQSLEVVFGIDYAQYWNYGLGIRTGLRYQPYNMDIGNWFCVPVHFSWRPKMSRSANVVDAAMDALGGVACNYYYYCHEPDVGSWLANFFAQMINRADLFIGLSPGYVQGGGSVHRYYVTSNKEQWKDMGIKKMSSFMLTADAGFTLSWRIWRFTLNFSPAVHYLITDNCHDYYVQNIQGEGSKFRSDRIRWQFSFEGGLRFLF